MSVEIEITRFIAFSDQSAVIPMLETLQAEVTNTANQFKPDFQ